MKLRTFVAVLGSVLMVGMANAATTRTPLDFGTIIA